MNNGIDWRFLVVEDNATIGTELRDAIPGFVSPPDSAEIDLCASFDDATKRLNSDRYDLIILDLKDDDNAWGLADDNPAGLTIFAHLKKSRFVPVIFYTALAHKVRGFETAFVRVVEKTEGLDKLKDEVMRVLATQLPALTRQVEEIQRSYMWDLVSNNWKEFENLPDQVDLAYLLARRLALSLQRQAGKLAQHVSGSLPIANATNIHPMEMYVWPHIGTNLLAGDILRGTIGDELSYWLVLTPSCDFEQAGRLENVLLARCSPLSATPEYAKWKDNRSDKELKALIGDRRQGKGIQPERFKFLPGTYFFPDSIVDFQQLRAVPAKDVASLDVIASLDSPFAEALLGRFSRYFGRLGTPDIDKEIVLNRLEAVSKSTFGESPDHKKE